MPKHRMFCSIILSLLIIPSTVNSASVRGAASCSHWIEAHREEASTKQAPMTFGFFRAMNMRSWILGYASAYNVYAASSDQLAVVEPSILFDWITKYCSENLNALAIDGVAPLFSKLKKMNLKLEKAPPIRKQ
jgi:hypothetical protein